jgi:hypothetical protein
VCAKTGVSGGNLFTECLRSGVLLFLPHGGWVGVGGWAVIFLYCCKTRKGSVILCYVYVI